MRVTGTVAAGELTRVFAVSAPIEPTFGSTAPDLRVAPGGAVLYAQALSVDVVGHHDRVHDDHPVELTLDLSPTAVPGAEVHYRRRGQVYFRVPAAPRSLAVVERGPTVTCNHTYVSKRAADATIIRLIVLLR